MLLCSAMFLCSAGLRSARARVVVVAAAAATNAADSLTALPTRLLKGWALPSLTGQSWSSATPPPANPGARRSSRRPKPLCSLCHQATFSSLEPASGCASPRKPGVKAGDPLDKHEETEVQG